MQQIYDDRAGKFKGPENTVVIQKHENYRCSIAVINLLNAIRPDLRQVPSGNNLTGSVEIRLIKTEKGNVNRGIYSDEQLAQVLKQFDDALRYFQWSKSEEFKYLFLTRQMIARRLGFSVLNSLFTSEVASKNAEDSFKEGTYFALLLFIDVLIPLIEAHSQKDQASIFKIMRDKSPLLDPEGPNKYKTVQEVIEKMKTAVDAIASIWTSNSIKDILLTAIKYRIIHVSERLDTHLKRSPRTEDYSEKEYGREREDWLMDKFLTYKTTELSAYRNFIFNKTPFSTQHGVKGDEFEKVLVVFDDTEANWNNYSFSRLFTPSTAGKGPTEQQKQRSLNLSYVCFSRAIKDLRIILFTLDPKQAKRELIDKNLFSDDQITIADT
jgi:DNA helicase-2/ATP-dependent DNA helicase PcrA